MQASRLADQASPMTKRAALTARNGAGSAAIWARPRVGRLRAWMAVRAVRSSVAMQETVAPRLSAVLTAMARQLDPPRPRSRRWPKVLAGTALLAAGAAAATALVLRRRTTNMTLPPPVRPPARSSAEPASAVLSQSDAERARSETEVNGLSRTR
jgi:hypothetical protein